MWLVNMLWFFVWLQTRHVAAFKGFYSKASVEQRLLPNAYTVCQPGKISPSLLVLPQTTNLPHLQRSYQHPHY